MKLEQTEQPRFRLNLAVLRPTRSGVWRFLSQFLIGGILVWAAFMQSTSAIPAGDARLRMFAMTAAGLSFDLIGWEVESLSAKLRAFITRPAASYNEEDAIQLVRNYMLNAIDVGHMERELELLESRPELSAEETRRVGELQSDLMALRIYQDSARPAVENILESQVSWALSEVGMGIGGMIIPPVLFAFTEPPRKLIVSPRDQISIAYTSMVRAGLPISILEQVEAHVAEQPNAVGYVSNIGGLGAYPAMVVDRANLRWTIATVAHEWAHNYLTFFPLGLLYFGSGDLTIMNETVADIVGEEIAILVMARYYPELLPPEILQKAEIASEHESDAGDSEAAEVGSDPEEALPADPETDTHDDAIDDEPEFDFRTEMRETRLEVDRLLAEGRVEDAERYMEMRRLLFVEHGYSIRVLNQAYFAFHGSYATSPASTSPIGPKMQDLRASTPDLPTFLHVVRWLTSQRDLDAALEQWAEGVDP